MPTWCCSSTSFTRTFPCSCWWLGFNFFHIALGDSHRHALAQSMFDSTLSQARSQPESAGVSCSAVVSRSQPQSAGVSRSAVVDRSQPESARVSRSQPESAGVSRSQPESAGGSRRQPESAGVSRSQLESAGVSRSQPESAVVSRSQPESAAASRSQAQSAIVSRQVFPPSLPAPCAYIYIYWYSFRHHVAYNMLQCELCWVGYSAMTYFAIIP